MSTTDSTTTRRTVVRDLLADIRQIIAAPITQQSLALVASRIEQLAARPELFPLEEFAPPKTNAGGATSTRYHLNPEDGDEDIALYLNSINPGKTTWPHNHATWAVIVAVEGEERNVIYRRLDDGSDPAHARLEVAREVIVKPGAPITFLPDDIHSIHVTGERPTRHFHLYGRPLETLKARIGIHPETGAVVNYNQVHMRPSATVNL